MLRYVQGGGGGTLLIYRAMPRVWDICMYNQMIVSHRRHAKRILQRLSLLCAVAWLKEGTFAPSASVISDRCYPGRLRVRSGVDYCAPSRRSFPSSAPPPPLPSFPSTFPTARPVLCIRSVRERHTYYADPRSRRESRDLRQEQRWISPRIYRSMPLTPFRDSSIDR